MITKERAEDVSKLYYNKILHYCLYLTNNNYEDSLEIAQEVFLVFTKKMNELKDDQIEHWLMAVAKKKAFEYYRYLKDEKMVYSIEDTFTDADEIFSTMTKFYSYSDADIKMTIEAIMKMLTKNEYDLFIKKFVENKSQAEIAEDYGISISSVSSRINRLRNKIEKLGFFCFTFVGQIIIKTFF